MVVRILTMGCIVFAAAATQAATPAQSCQSSKNKEAGNYAYCRQKAEGKFAVTGDAAARTTALGKCQTKYDTKWPKLEAKAVAQGGACPSEGDQAPIRGFVDTHTDVVAAALAGGALPDCPGDLATCEADLATAETDLTTCTGDLGTCTTGLATCLATPQGQRLKTGQTTCWDTAGVVIACAGTGQDGDLQRGLARAYVDKDDSTITDTRTGLMWEKQSDDGTLNDKDNLYT